MDFIVGLPLSFGFTAILAVVDRLSKYGHFIPLKSDFNSKTVAELFMNHIVKLHGMPRSIVSDRDKVFTSSFWKNLFAMQGTTLNMSTPTILNQMDNLRLSTSAWKCTCDVSLSTILRAGIRCLHGLSIGTIHLSTPVRV